MSEIVFGTTAEELAQIISLIARPVKKNGKKKKPLLKLPPVFTCENHALYGNGLQNIEVMIKILSEYQKNYSSLTLQDIPGRYNALGGLPVLTKKDGRKIHNWMQQVMVAIRAAVIIQESKAPSSIERFSLVERVVRRLYDRDYSRRVYVTFAPGDRYELKPLRYASEAQLGAWIEQEYAQKQQWSRGENVKFGAVPTQTEWELYGVKCQVKTVVAHLTKQIQQMLDLAFHFEDKGDYSHADDIDTNMDFMRSQLNIF